MVYADNQKINELLIYEIGNLSMEENEMMLNFKSLKGCWVTDLI